jgi:hypothetical protein
MEGSMSMDMSMDALRLHVVELGERHGRAVAREEHFARTPYDPTNSVAASRLHDYAAGAAAFAIERLHVREGLSLTPSQQHGLADAYREAFLGGYRDWKRYGSR